MAARGTIPFRGARFSQMTTPIVAPGGTLIYGDLLSPAASRGRIAGLYPPQHPPDRAARSHAALPRGFSLLPGLRSPLGRGLLGPDAATLGTLLIVTDALAPEALRDALRAALKEARVGMCVGAWLSLPGGGGVCVKALGEEAQYVGRLLRTAWAVARQLLWGVGLPPTRKY